MPPKFAHGAIRATITNTVRDGMAYIFFKNVLSRAPGLASWAGAYAMIAAYSHEVEGVQESSGMRVWQPPDLFSTEEAVIQSAELFFTLIADMDAITAWVEAINGLIIPQPPVVPAEERGSGDAEADFLAPTAPASTSILSIAPSSADANPPPSPKLKAKK